MKVSVISNSPEWARYAARSKDGYWYFFSHKPKPSASGWVCGGIKERLNDFNYKHEDWPFSLLTIQHEYQQSPTP